LRGTYEVVQRWLVIRSDAGAEVVLRNLPLRDPSVLDIASLQTVIRATRGNTARIFELFGDLAVAAIRNGEERITADAIGAWRPSVYDRSLAG